MLLSQVDYHDAERMSHAVIQAEYGEKFTITPMVTRPNYPTARDKSRVEFDAPGVFDWESKNIGLKMGEVAVSSREPRVTFQKCDLLYSPRRGDVLMRICGREMFEVTDTQPDGMSGIAVCLQQLGLPN